MLQKLDHTREKGASIDIKDAAFPRPFPWKLEFNPPVHETWNIVHIGMQVPEAHQIYICGDNCMRGVVLTAAEMDALDRFSSVILTERDFIEGRLEEITLEGITDVIRKLKKRPRAVLVFPVCVHHFVGTDMNYVYRCLEERFPDIDFIRCFMDPIMQKGGLAPDQKERKAILDILPVLPKEERLWLEAGSNVALREESDLAKLLNQAGVSLKSTYSCQTYEEFLTLGGAGCVITRMPVHEIAIRPFAARRAIPWCVLAPEVTYEKLACQRKEVLSMLKLSEEPSIEEKERALTEEAFKRAKGEIGDTPIELDAVALTRPLGWARQLLSHGFSVRRIYLDGCLPEEEDDFLFLKEHYPSLKLACPSDIRWRRWRGSLAEEPDKEEAGERKVLAVGPKAAYLADTPYFVNVLEQDGGWGYSGVRHLLTLMCEAHREKKDVRDIVPRKGLGCPCIIDI